jgi:outer membrane protein assembly factor BamB
MPPLTLRGNAVPRISGTVVVAGFDNGRVGAYALTTGEPRWELAIAAPTGRNELDRLVDVSTDLQIVGNDVFVSSYHGRALGIDIVTGLVIWQQELSSFAGLGVDSSFVYVSDEVGTVIALDRRGGQEAWRQPALRLRDVTAPTRFGRAVVVADYQGYLHWLDPVNGAFIARVRGAPAQITVQPLVSGSDLIVQGEDGTVAAFAIVDEEPDDEASD